MNNLANTNAWRQTINPGNVDSPLTDFPVYAVADEFPLAFHNAIRSDAQDLEVYNSDGTKLNRDVGRYDSAADAGEWWCGVNVSDLVDTNIDWECGSGTSLGNDTEVWTDPGYDRVFHCEESAGSTIADSSGSNDLTGQNGATLGATGYLGGGVDLEADSDQYASGSSPHGRDFTVEGWFKFESATSFPGLIHFQSQGGRRIGMIRSVNSIQVDLEDNGGALDYYQSAALTWTNGTWYRVVATAEVETPAAYINGSSVALLFAGGGGFSAESDELQIGRQNIPGDYTFDGIFDEIRHASVAFSAAWEKFNHAIQSDNSSNSIYSVVPQSILSAEAKINVGYIFGMG